MKYEYKVETLYDQTAKEMQSFLNTLGAEGWELVSVTPEASCFIAYFLRPVS